MPRNCLIVPLAKGALPYLAKLSRTQKTNRCLVFDVALLKSKQDNFARNLIHPWGEVLERHLAMEDKLVLKDMTPFGRGVFAKRKVLQHEYVIYPGQLIDSSINDLPVKERVYFLKIQNENDKDTDESNLHFDPKYTVCVEKYFQHLPSPDYQEFAYLDGVEPALENLTSYCVFVNITLKRDTFVIPVRILVANKNIEPGSIMGFDYGKNYWRCLEQEFTYFTNKGKPISCYYLHVKDRRYQLSQILLDRLIKQGYLISFNRLLFLPANLQQAFKKFPIPDNCGSLPITLYDIGDFDFDSYYSFYNTLSFKREAILIKHHDLAKNVLANVLWVSFFMDVEAAIFPSAMLHVSSMLGVSLEALIKLEIELKHCAQTALDIKKDRELTPQDVEPLAEKILIYSLVKHGLFRQAVSYEFSKTECLGVTQRRGLIRLA